MNNIDLAQWQNACRFSAREAANSLSIAVGLYRHWLNGSIPIPDMLPDRCEAVRATRIDISANEPRDIVMSIKVSPSERNLIDSLRVELLKSSDGMPSRATVLRQALSDYAAKLGKQLS